MRNFDYHFTVLCAPDTWTDLSVLISVKWYISLVPYGAHTRIESHSRLFNWIMLHENVWKRFRRMVAYIFNENLKTKNMKKLSYDML